MGHKTAMKSLAMLVALALIAPVLFATEIPANTRVSVRSNSAMSSASAKIGDAWDGTLAKDLVVDGNTVFKAGTAVRGKVTNAKPSGRLKDSGLLTLRLTSIGGKAVTSAPRVYRGESHTKSNVTKIGGGAAAGAVIGAIAGGGKGAAIGSAIGAGAGTGAAAYTGRKDAVIPAETVMAFTVSTKPASGAKLKQR